MNEPIITNLPDGAVRVQLGAYFGTVSSHHLVDPLVNRFRRYAKTQHTLAGNRKA